VDGEGEGAGGEFPVDESRYHLKDWVEKRAGTRLYGSRQKATNPA